MYKTSLDFISNDLKTSTGSSFCATGQLLWGKQLQVTCLILTESKGGDTQRVQINGGLCSFGARICLEWMRGGKHSPPLSVLCFPLKEKSKKKKKKKSPYLLTPSRS